MTYPPGDLAEVRGYLVHRLDLQPGTARSVDLEANEVGIVGNAAHRASGGYHVGADDLKAAGRLDRDYSVVESSRDRIGLTNAASALDIGSFDATVSSRRITLASLSMAIVQACERGDPRARDIREVIYSPDGRVVRRWDRLRIRSGGDDSHLWHTHISFFRDSEGRRHQQDNFLGLAREIIEGGSDMGLTAQEYSEIVQGAITKNNSLFYWLRRIAEGADPMTGQPAGTGLPQLAARLDRLLAAAEQEQVRDAALRAVLDTISRSGTSVDTSAILAAVDELRTEFGTQLVQLQQRVDDTERERDELQQRLAAALSGQAGT